MKFKTGQRFYPAEIRDGCLYIDGRKVQVETLKEQPAWRKNIYGVFNLVVAIFICMTGVKFLMTGTLVGMGIFIVVSGVFTYAFMYSSILYFRGRFYALATPELKGTLIGEEFEKEDIQEIIEKTSREARYEEKD